MVAAVLMTGMRVVHPSVPVQTIAEFSEFAKGRRGSVAYPAAFAARFRRDPASPSPSRHDVFQRRPHAEA
jgi:hypothetical protein